MKRVPTLLTVVALMACCAPLFSAAAQTVSHTSVKPKSAHGHKAPMRHDQLTLYPHGRPRASRIGVWLHAPPVRPSDPDPQYFHGRAALVMSYEDRNYVRPERRIEDARRCFGIDFCSRQAGPLDAAYALNMIAREKQGPPAPVENVWKNGVPAVCGDMWDWHGHWRKQSTRG
jgi:hypothetical protein